MPKDTITYLQKPRIEKSEQGKCESCGNPAELKVAVWDRIKVMTYSDEMGWRILRLCQKCNEKEKCIDFEKVWDHIGY